MEQKGSPGAHTREREDNQEQNEYSFSSGFQRHRRQAIEWLKKLYKPEPLGDLNLTIIDKVITARQLLYVGHSFQNEGRNDEVIKSCDQAVQIVDETNRSDIKEKAYQRVGNVYTAIPEYEKAIEYYQKAYNNFQEGQYKKSMEFWNEVVKLSSSFGYKEREMNAYLGLGSAACNTGDFKSSLGYFSKALTIAEQLNDKALQRVVHTNLACIYYKSCQFEAAAESYLKVREISQDLGDDKEESNAHLMIGNSFQQLKQPEKAIESYRKALNISKDSDAVQRLAFAFLSIGQYEKAQEYLKMLIELTGNLNDSGMEQVLNQKRLAMCYFTLERVEKSLACFMKALELIRDLSDKTQEAIINEWCGYCNRFIAGRNEEAMEFYESAKRISKEVGEKYQEYRTNQAIGNILANTGGYEKAKKYYEEAIKVATELNDRHREGTSLLSFAWVCHKSYDDDIAIEWYKKAYSVSKELNDHLLQEKALIGQGIAWFYRGNAQKAIDLLREARSSNEEEPELGHHHEATISKEKWESAKQYFDDTAEVCETKFDDQIKTVPTLNPEKNEKESEYSQKKTNTVHVGKGDHDKRTFLKQCFLDNEYSIKEEVHEKLKRFTWLCGAYGVTRANETYPYPHLYVTVKTGKNKSDVYKDIEEAFNSEAKDYFEVYFESNDEPTFLYLCGARPSPGGGIVAKINDDTRNHTQVNASGTATATGTITMFCSLDGVHYALTCFHVGCVIFDQIPDGRHILDEVVEIRNSIDQYKERARHQIEYINPSNRAGFGTFYKAEFHSKADIMSIKVREDTAINCTIAEVNSPNWGELSEELSDKVYNGVGEVRVEKVGYSSNTTEGRIVQFNYCYCYNNESLFRDAIVVKSNNFLEPGDAGALIFYIDERNQKHAIAYGVCEVSDIGDAGNSRTSAQLSASAKASGEFEGASTSRVCERKDGNKQENEERFFICLKLNVALRELELEDAGCFSALQ